MGSREVDECGQIGRSAVLGDDQRGKCAVRAIKVEPDPVRMVIAANARTLSSE
jgi:hypothetical protein